MSTTENKQQKTRAVFKSPGFQKKDILWYIFGFGVPLAFILGGIWSVSFGSLGNQPISQNAWFLLGLVLFIPILLISYRSIKRWRLHIETNRAGLFIRSLNGKNYSFAWKNLRGVATRQVAFHLLGFETTRRFEIHVYPTTGEPVIIPPEIKRPELLHDIIKGQIYPGLLAEYKVQFQNGRTIHLKDIQLSRQSFSYRGQSIPWNEISRITIQGGALVVEHTPRGRIQIPLDRVINPEIMLQLIDEEIT